MAVPLKRVIFRPLRVYRFSSIARTHNAESSARPGAERKCGVKVSLFRRSPSRRKPERNGYRHKLAAYARHRLKTFIVTSIYSKLVPTKSGLEYICNCNNHTSLRARCIFFFESGRNFYVVVVFFLLSARSRKASRDYEGCHNSFFGGY